MKILMILALLSLVACNQGSDGPDYEEMAPTGILNKQWSINGGYNDFSIQSVDLTDQNNIEINGVRKITRRNPPLNGTDIVSNLFGDCVVASTGSTVLTSYYSKMDTTLVSGDPALCSSFVPTLTYKHFRNNRIDNDILVFSGINML